MGFKCFTLENELVFLVQVYNINAQVIKVGILAGVEQKGLHSVLLIP